MKLFNMAFEDEDTSVVSDEVADEREPEVIITDADTTATSSVNELESIEEGADILETTTEIANNLSEKVESGEGVDETASALIEPALEHFYSRMGYVGKRTISASLEDFKSKDTRLEATKCVLEELTDYNNKLASGLSIAQEGLMSRIGNSLKLLFTSAEKIQEKLIANMAEIETKGAKTTLIKEPGWGRSFAVIGKRHLTPADVTSFMKKYSAALSSPDFISIVDDFVTIVTKVTNEVSKSRFIASNDSIKAINDLAAQIPEFRAKVDQYLLNNTVKNAKNDPSFDPLDINGAKILGKAAIDLMNDHKLNSAVTKINTTVLNANNTIFLESQIRLVKAMAKDIRATQNLINQLNPIIQEVLVALQQRARICYAVSNYIKASTN